MPSVADLGGGMSVCCTAPPSNTMLSERTVQARAIRVRTVADTEFAKGGGVQAYNGGPGAEPPAGSKGTASGGG